MIPEDVICTGCGGFAGCDSFAGKCPSCNARERAAEEERLDTKDCPKCHSATRHWGRKASRIDGREYCVGCASAMERVWTIANSCMACGEVKAEWEEKVFPPERIQERDEYVKSGQVGKRFVCRGCFEMMTRKKFGAVVRQKRNESTPILKRISCLLGVGRNG